MFKEKLITYLATLLGLLNAIPRKWSIHWRPSKWCGCESRDL